MTVAVVGAGLAGLRTCEALRHQGHSGGIVLVGAEKHAPYDRPPLSKEVLRGEAGVDTTTLRDAEQLHDLDLDLRPGRLAMSLDVAGREVALDDGSTIAAEHIVIATGAAPMSLPGTAPRGVHVLRTIEDCLTLRDSLDDGTRVVVVGAGFIGLEVAASARSRGCAVTVVDALAAPLARVLDPVIGGAITRLHQVHGVEIRCGIGVRSLVGDPHVTGVELADGTVLPADVVVVGIGVRPATEWCASSGLTIADGIVCDESLGAAPGIWAVGDVARWTASRPDGSARVEHWTNATEQARVVARNIVSGEAEPFETVPYFWSDQYDVKLQALGHAGIGDETRIVNAVDESKFVVLVREGDRLGGVVGLRSARHVMAYRPLLAEGASWADAVDLAESRS